MQKQTIILEVGISQEQNLDLVQINFKDKGVFEWLGLKEKDRLHRLVAGKYLKQLMRLHEERGTLDVHKDQIEQLCATCFLPRICKACGKEKEMTCFCLESILPYMH